VQIEKVYKGRQKIVGIGAVHKRLVLLLLFLLLLLLLLLLLIPLSSLSH
jgi:hypothetical protein